MWNNVQSPDCLVCHYNTLQDPIPASWPCTIDGSVAPFSVGYFKGKTRIQVLMCLLSVARDSGLDNYSEAG